MYTSSLDYWYKKGKDEVYIATYDNGQPLQPCVKLKAFCVEEAKDKFCEYLNGKGINVQLDKLYLIPLAYVPSI